MQWMEEGRRDDGPRKRGQRRGRDRDREDGRRRGRDQAGIEFDMEMETDGARIMMMDGGAFGGEVPEDMMNMIMDLVGEAMDENGLEDGGEAAVRVITRSMSSSSEDGEEAERGMKRKSRDGEPDKERRKRKNKNKAAKKARAKNRKRKR